MMKLRDFLNAVNTLRTIDMSDAVTAGVIADGDAEEYAALKLDPIRWLKRADPARQEKLWTIIDRRITSRPQ